MATPRVELIWHMSLTSLNDTDNEIRIPTPVSDCLTREEIAVLESRLSLHLDGAPTVSFKDLNMNVYRILLMPEMQTAASSPATSMSPAASFSTISSPSPQPSTMNNDATARQYGKKAKIPRPPNAFILYRQKHHPILKAENPGLHNNDISVILGQQWKNEDASTRESFKALADELKRQHFLKFPDYQYAPRKASEKKRRMTARKLAKVQSLEAGQDTSDFPSYNAFDIEFNNTDTYSSTHNTTAQANFAAIPTTNGMLGGGNQSQSLIAPLAPTQDVTRDLNSVLHHPDTTPEEAAAFEAFEEQFTNSFMNTLIDWDSIEEAFKLTIQRDVSNKDQESSQSSNNQLYAKPMGNGEQNVFQKEIKRTNHMFE